jgi:hypothetical protein
MYRVAVLTTTTFAQLLCPVSTTSSPPWLAVHPPSRCVHQRRLIESQAEDTARVRQTTDSDGGRTGAGQRPDTAAVPLPRS